jgi:hypothetical protein
VITAKVFGTHAVCARPGCQAPALGELWEDEKGAWHLLTSRRWEWDADATPPRWRHRDKSPPRDIPSANKRGGAGLMLRDGPARATYRRDDFGARWVIPLPVVMECRCKAVQAVTR